MSPVKYVNSMKLDENSSKEMDKLYAYHNRLRQFIIDDTKHFSQHPLMKKIADWEKQSILKIQQTANGLRQELKQVYTKHSVEISDLFTKLSHELDQARMENHFLEKDILYWLKKFQDLKIEFRTPKTINIHVENDSEGLISKIKLLRSSIDTFHQSIGDIHADNDTKTIVHGPTKGDATIRGTREYQSGIHHLRFHIDRLGIPKWIFFGIISKNTPLQADLYRTPSAFGWAGQYQVWLNGMHHHRYNGYSLDMKENDIMEFIIDCDRQKIFLRNEATNSTYEMNISIDKCPFPWILYIGLYGVNDQIRLLLA